MSQVYRYCDATTDTSVTLERNVTPWTSWDVRLSNGSGLRTLQYDSLIDAASDVAALVIVIGRDDDAPGAERALEDIAAHFDDPKIYVGYDEGDGGGVYLINEYEWDED